MGNVGAFAALIANISSDSSLPAIAFAQARQAGLSSLLRRNRTLLSHPFFILRQDLQD